MATKSAVPQHLKANGGEDRHHGKTQSHVVRIRHFPITFALRASGRAGGGAEQTSSEQQQQQQSSIRSRADQSKLAAWSTHRQHSGGSSSSSSTFQVKAFFARGKSDQQPLLTSRKFWSHRSLVS